MMERNRTPLPSQEVLHALLDYNADSGILFWKLRPGNNPATNRFNGKLAGKPAFTATTKAGYRQGEVAGVKCVAHRLIWKWCTGEEPDVIDHINGDVLDNRIINLRSVTHRENMKNQKLRSTNSSGVSGVCFVKSRGRYQASISGRTIGLFETKEAAVAARKAAEESDEYHVNHGRAEGAI